MAMRFKKLRLAAGLTQGQLARAAGVSPRTYEGWEQGRNTPLLDAAAKLARALGVSLDELAGLKKLRRKGKGE